MKKLLVILTVTGFISFLLIGSQVNAAIIDSWSDEASFQSANAPLLMEGFENPSSISFPMVSGDINISTDSTNYGTFNGVNTNQDFGVTDGIQNIRVGFDAGNSIWFDFASPIDVFGVNIWGFGDVSDSPILTFYDNMGNSGVALSGFQSSTQDFYGIRSNIGIVSLQFTYTGGSGDGVYFDELYYGVSAVPIPTAVWLLGSGLIGLVGFRRKFKKE